jgi:hypothetical protein
MGEWIKAKKKKNKKKIINRYDLEIYTSQNMLINLLAFFLLHCTGTALAHWGHGFSNMCEEEKTFLLYFCLD